MVTLLKWLDRVSGTSGAVAAWLLFVLIFATCYETFARYVLGAPTIWSFEVGYMMMGTHFLIGLAYTLRENEHVRVDIFYRLASPRVKALIDSFIYLCLVLPVTLWLSIALWTRVLTTYEKGERSGASAFNAPLWPIRAVFFAAFVLLSLQAIAQLIRCYYAFAGKPQPEQRP